MQINVYKLSIELRNLIKCRNKCKCNKTKHNQLRICLLHHSGARSESYYDKYGNNTYYIITYYSTYKYLIHY